MQQLLHGIGSDIWSNGVPSVVGDNEEEDDLLTSSKKGMERHCTSIVRIEQKYQQTQWLTHNYHTNLCEGTGKELCKACITNLYARIDALEDSRRAMAIHITKMENQRMIDILKCEIKIDDDIDMLAMPTRSNRSPDDM